MDDMLESPKIENETSEDGLNETKFNDATFSIDQEEEALSDNLASSLTDSCAPTNCDDQQKAVKLRFVTDFAEREKLFRERIEQCCKIYDFTLNSFDDLELKDDKNNILVELEDIILDEPDLITPFECLYSDLFRMFSVNLFRPLPPPTNQNIPEYDPEEDDAALEPAWPHLQPVYNLLARFLECPHFDLNRARPYINSSFTSNLLALFESEDPREREYLKTILHTIYRRFSNLRCNIRRQVNNIFSSFVYETGYHSGIADLLEIIGSIISGFVLPLKEEHKMFLLRVLLPLHKARTMNAYHQQLSFCVLQFIEKDHTLAEPVIKSLLRYWPKVHSPKEVMFLGELEEILDIIDPSDFQKVMVPLFKQLGRCIRSNQFQVAERVLYLWNNEYILSLINDNVQTILPIVFPALYIEPNAHWNKTIHGLIYNALKLSTEMNQRLFHELVQQYNSDRNKAKTSQEDREKQWQKIQEMAEANGTEFSLVEAQNYK